MSVRPLPRRPRCRRFGEVGVATAAAVAVLLAGCGGADQAGPAHSEASLTSNPTANGPAAGSPTSGAPGSPTSSALPTAARRPGTTPSAPPKRPTDVFVPSRIEGTVVPPSAPGCVELLADSGVRWSLVGDLAQRLDVGQRVRLTVRGVPESAAPPGCTGAATARVEAVTVLTG